MMRNKENIQVLPMNEIPAPPFCGGWLLLFQLAGKENVGHAANINIKDVVSLVLDQFAGIAYKMQLGLFVFHTRTFLRQFSKNVPSTVWRPR